MADLNDRLPPEAIAVLDSMVPQDKAKVPAGEVLQAYRTMLSYLVDNRQWLFPSDPKSFCVVHGRQCSLCPAAAATSSSAKRQRTTAEIRQMSRSDDSADCPAPLRINTAGTTCVGWSSAGKSLQFRDPSERPHAIWSVERLRRAELQVEDVFVSECTPRCPVKDWFLVGAHEPSHLPRNLCR